MVLLCGVICVILYVYPFWYNTGVWHTHTHTHRQTETHDDGIIGYRLSIVSRGKNWKKLFPFTLTLKKLNLNPTWRTNPNRYSNYGSMADPVWVRVIYTVRRYAKRGICRRRVSVCLSVWVSVTLKYCIKTAKRRITRITPHDSPVTLAFWHQRFTAKFERDHPIRGRQMQVGWVKIRHFRRKTRYNTKTVQDRCMVSIKVE